MTKNTGKIASYFTTVILDQTYVLLLIILCKIIDCNNNNNNLQMNLSEQSSLSIFAQKLYFINVKIIILSYKISTYLLIYKDSF